MLWILVQVMLHSLFSSNSQSLILFSLNLGVFTVPRAGTYVFTFSAIKLDKARYVNVYLYVNEVDKVASVYGSQHSGYFSLSLQSLLRLKVGDRIQLVVESLAGGGIYDDKDSTTQFGGNKRIIQN